MKAEKTLKDVDEIELMQKRFKLITVAKYRDRNKIRRASKTIDKIRKKAGKSSISMTDIVRKWRDARYGPSSS